MIDFKQMIHREGEEIARLHSEVHETCKNRSKDLIGWKRACEKFHSYVSPMDKYIDIAYEEKCYSDFELLEFAICFLEVDPLFFRSGYVKEELLRKLKRTELNVGQIKRLNAVLEDAVDSRGSREFRAYCRLAAMIASEKLISSVGVIAKYGNNSRKSRANLMLSYIDQNAKST
ncbi:hypothetical protein [Teredinibacter turnerae]|uniref:hypothetical protein n=1 Tax=Teredinibacter turnerae TaxID=2426 RepID=UPI0030CF7BD1